MLVGCLVKTTIAKQIFVVTSVMDMRCLEPREGALLPHHCSQAQRYNFWHPINPLAKRLSKSLRVCLEIC
jgi:hypothetical protein